MNVLAVKGEEKSYYNAVECYQRTSSNFKILAAKYEFSNKFSSVRPWKKIRNLMVAYFERMIIVGAGNLNEWGGSIGRPALLGSILVTVFSLIYMISGVGNDLVASFIMSVDITLLIGYTKHSNSNFSYFSQLIFMLNMSLGLIWYSIMVPTVINRISRVV